MIFHRFEQLLQLQGHAYTTKGKLHNNLIERAQILTPRKEGGTKE